MHEVNDMKAERVQLWERVVESARSFCRRAYDLFEWLEIKGRAGKDFFAGRDHLRR